MADSPEGRREDPFQRHLDFLDSRPVHEPTAHRSSIQPVEHLEVRGTDMVDLEALAERSQWRGMFKEPVPMEEDSYPEGMDEAMAHCEPPLVLRNLGRAERHGDPSDPLPLEDAEAPYGLPAESVGGAGSLDFEPASPDMDLSVRFMEDRGRTHRWLFRDLPWESRFSREIKDTISGPLWAWDPTQEAASEAPDGGDEES